MSSSLVWEPQDRKKKNLSDELKYALRKKYGGAYVGSVECVMSDDDLPYLEGLRDAGIRDAQKLIDAIKKHESIIVTEEH